MQQIEEERWMIPPPFPFPSAWPEIFQTNQTTWLTPSTPIVFTGHRFMHIIPPVVPIVYPPMHHHPIIPTEPSYIQEQECAAHGVHDEDDRNSECSSSSSGEYEYGYVLDEAWQERFLESVRAGRIRGISTQEETSKSSQTRRPVNKKKAKKKQQALLNAQAKKKSSQDLFLKEKQAKLATAMAKAAAKDRAIMQRHQSLENIYTSSTNLQDSDRRRRRIEHLETILNMAFDQFCDTNHPDVWPT